jgi:hypothetical protein
MTSPEIDLTVSKNHLGLFEAEVTLTLPPITLSCVKADRDDLEYQIRNDFSEIVGEIVTKLVGDEF